MVRVLVTRPEPDNARTGAALIARGAQPILAPVLVFRARDGADLDGVFSGLIVTSANALRALRDHPVLARLKQLPLYAVGPATAAMARDLGFADIVAGESDAMDLQRSILAHAPQGRAAPLLYLAGAQINHDLAGALRACGLDVVMRVVYAMDAVVPWPSPECREEVARGFDAVLHYSARSAEVFIASARAAGLEDQARRACHLCLSEQVAGPLRAAGFARIGVAAAARETGLLDELARQSG